MILNNKRIVCKTEINKKIIILLISLVFFQATIPTNTLANPPTNYLINKLTNSNMQEERNMSGKITKNQIPSEEFLKGQTNLRFMVFPSPWRIRLNAGNPETYTFGIKNCLGYLLWINQNGQMDLWKWTKVEHEKVNHTANEIVKIFTSDFDEDMRYDIYMEVIMILKILNRLDEINTQKLAQIIQSYQLEDGGFKSIAWNYSVLKETLEAVIALDCVRSKPVNCSAVRDFVYNLQVIESPYESDMYEFRENLNEQAGTPFGTLKAYLILEKLGFAMPHKEELQKKFEKELTNFQVYYTNWSLDEKRVQLFWLITRSFMFPEIGKNVREELLTKAWEIHESLPDDHAFLKYTWGSGAVESFFTRTMTLLGNANPKLDVYLSPKELVAEEKIHNCKILVNNSSPFEYHFSLKDLEIVNSIEDYNVQKKNEHITIILKANEHIEIPITIERKEAIKKKSQEANIKMKATLTVPVMHTLWDLTNVKNLTTQVYFTIPIKNNQTSTTPTSIGGGGGEDINYKQIILPLFTGTSLLTLGTVIPLIRKRKK